MPIHLPPLSRRAFLRGALAAGAGLVLGRDLFAATEADPHLIAFLSDPHIDARGDTIVRMTNMTDNLKAVAAEVAGLSRRPAHVLVNGDCAYLKGEPGDYAQFVKLLEPIRAAQMPVHVTLGNHDHRENCWQGIESAGAAKRPVTDKHVTVLRLPRANLFLLDTLDKVNVTPGLLGEDQVKWLGAALDEHKDKPAIVVAHHNLDDGTSKGGLKDTAALLEVLAPRKHVKAYVFGHTHRWENKKHESGIHLINLPPVAYAFTAGKPNGWVQAQLQENGIRLELSCLDKKHAAHQEAVELKWRA